MTASTHAHASPHARPIAELAVVGMRKEYPGTVALDDVSMRFDGGRVHALLGKNGAGKSTLVKILAGTVAPTRGMINVNGRAVSLRSAQDAFDQGIATVYQELSLVPGLTVGENILLGRLPRKHRCMIDWAETFRRAQAVLNRMRVQLDPRAIVGSLSVGQQQIVEIAKAMSFVPSVLMLDEPTSALAHHETETLFSLVRGLADQGVVIIYITHRLQELGRIADTITVLRDGRLAGVLEAKDATPDAIVRMMFGETVARQAPGEAAAGARPVLEARGLGRRGAFHDVSFVLREGEVLGIAGMLGSGRTELLRALFGAEPYDTGTLLINDVPVPPCDPAAMKRRGLGYTPEDRKAHALVQSLSVRANTCLTSLDRIARHGVIWRGDEAAITRGLIDRLAIAVPDIEDAVGTLSGGNQQKVVIGKWLNAAPRVLLLDEPTRGIDVQAKEQIFKIVADLSAKGIASIVVSSEIEELFEICHRILVMKHGMIVEDAAPAAIGADELYIRCMEE